MNSAVAALRTQPSWFARFRAQCAHAWQLHLRTCEMIAESRRDLF
jgi:hypothetical protein